MLEQEQRRPIGPVEVFEDQQDGRGARELPEQRRDCLEHQVALRLRPTGPLFETGQPALELWHQGSQVAGPDAESGPQLFGRGCLDVAPERLDERLERDDRILVVAAEEHEASP